MIKIALIGIVGILLALQIKAVKPEYAVYLCMGVSLLIFMGVTEQLQIIVDAIQAVSYTHLGAENGDWKFVIRWKRSGRSFLIWPIILSMLMRERSARAILRFREDIGWDW